MKESIGYTVTLNIMIVFITIVVAFLCAALIYFKSNKVSNIITTAIEKYEGYNSLAIDEINRNLTSIGYGSRPISCINDDEDSVCYKKECVEDKADYDGICNLIDDNNGRGINGYCVYMCIEDVEELNYADYYFYKIRTNMMLEVPIIHDILDIPVYSNTNRLYNFNKK